MESVADVLSIVLILLAAAVSALLVLVCYIDANGKRVRFLPKKVQHGIATVGWLMLSIVMAKIFAITWFSTLPERTFMLFGLGLFGALPVRMFIHYCIWWKAELRQGR